MMRMMQHLVVGGNQDSSNPTPEGSVPQSENETQPPPYPNQGQTTQPFIPQGGDQELNPLKDKTLKSTYGQVKSQVETLTKKIHIIKGSTTRGSIDLDSLTNFPQVITPPKFKAPRFVKYMTLEILTPICACSIGRWHPMEIIILCFARFSLIS